MSDSDTRYVAPIPDVPPTAEVLKSLNLYQRINEIRKRVSYIKKDKQVDMPGAKYTAVTHDNVTAMIRQHMVEFGVLCTPTLICSSCPPKPESAKQSRYDATYKFSFINIDAPNEVFDCLMEAHAMDNGDKAPGKALSYAKKAVILKIFEIESGDDDEGRYKDDEEPELTGQISEEQVDDILRIFKTSGAPTAGFCKHYKISKIEELPAARFSDAMKSLRQREKIKQEKDANNVTPEASQ